VLRDNNLLPNGAQYPLSDDARPHSRTWDGLFASKTLLSAVELELFTELAKNPEGLQSIEKRMGLHARSARDFLDALVSLGMLERENGVYRNTPETDVFLDKRKPSYIGGILAMANRRLYPFWAHLTEALRTGVPENESKDHVDFFGAIYADPGRLKEFLHSMPGISHGANMAIAAKFPPGPATRPSWTSARPRGTFRRKSRCKTAT
jgi:hypothetical protein